MAVGVASTGIHHTTNLKFSELRREFKTISPRSTFDGSDDHSGDTGSVSASELLRNTSLSVSDPSVPDVLENSDIATTESNWNISGFKNAIKYYYLNQTGIDDNQSSPQREGFSIADPTLNTSYTTDDVQSWEDYVSKNIVKKAFVDGIVGSISTTKDALSIGDNSTDIYNLTVSIGGSIYGSAGIAGNVGVVRIVIPSSYNFPLGAAVTQYTGVGTNVAVGIVSIATNSGIASLYEYVDQEFIHRQTNFSIVAAAGNLFVNDVDTGLKPTQVQATNPYSTNYDGFDGGNSVSFNLTGQSNNVKLGLGIGATIYGGGGGGGAGGNGGHGGASGNTQNNHWNCNAHGSCNCSPQSFPNPGGTGSPGGSGGFGRGYLSINRFGTETPDEGGLFYTSPLGTRGAYGASGGDGGGYGLGGDIGGTGGTGAHGQPTAGTSDGLCGQSGTLPGYAGQPGQAGGAGGGAGKAIKGSGWAWASGTDSSSVQESRQIRGANDGPVLP